MLRKSNTRSFITRKDCRICGNKVLEPILSLGTQYLTNFISGSHKNNFAVPLELVLCNKEKGGCGLVQLKHTVFPNLLYRNFWYKSGINQTMRNALKDIVTKAERKSDLKERDIVVDVGANDGTLLRSYTIRGLRKIGFEPAVNLIEEASVETTKIINEFFNYESFRKEFKNERAKIITCIAMFYDLDNPNQFVSDIKKILDDDGIWIIQMNYLALMLKNNAFDNIVHEHLEYYSLDTLQNLLDRHELTIFDVELNEINGGSFRVYVKHSDCKKYLISKKVENLQDYEQNMKLDSLNTYLQFSKRISILKNRCRRFIENKVKKGETVYAYGASTRGNTLLQFYALDHKLIKAAIDRNPQKWGKKTVSTLIPIISEEKARLEKPDYFLILPWYFLKEFRLREDKYLRKGGKFIVPLPEFQTISFRRRSN